MRTLVERSETERWSSREFLGVLLAEEVAQRQQTRIQRAVRQARFPFLQTIDGPPEIPESVDALLLQGPVCAPF
jgi:DNA replication protein DnaC